MHKGGHRKYVSEEEFKASKHVFGTLSQQERGADKDMEVGAMGFS